MEEVLHEKIKFTLLIFLEIRTKKLFLVDFNLSIDIYVFVSIPLSEFIIPKSYLRICNPFYFIRFAEPTIGNSTLQISTTHFRRGLITTSPFRLSIL